MTATTFHATNFRALRHVKWQPEGLCLLAGPNGAGKTTTLDMLRFLRLLFMSGHEAAFTWTGSDHFRRLGTPESEPVEFRVEVGDVCWTLRFPMSHRGLNGTYGEELRRGSQMILRAGMFDDGFYLGTKKQPHDERRCGLKWYWDREEPDWLRPLQDVLDGLRPYPMFCLREVRRLDSESGTKHFLGFHGNNLFAVLEQWQSARSRYPQQFDWVIAEARRAFPDIFDRIEFDQGNPVFFRPGSFEPGEGLSVRRIADGLLMALLQLTAVAGAKPGSVVALDEFESHLHPHAIRSLLGAIRSLAAERNLTVVLTTHSPVVLNSFGDSDKVYVVGEQTGTTTLASLSELHDEDWLAQAKLGTLYERLAFGAPPISAPADPEK